MTHTRKHRASRRGGQGTGASKIAPAPQAPKPRLPPRPIQVPPAQIIPAAPRGGRTRRRSSRRGGKFNLAKYLEGQERESLLAAAKRIVKHPETRMGYDDNKSRKSSQKHRSKRDKRMSVSR